MRALRNILKQKGLSLDSKSNIGYSKLIFDKGLICYLCLKFTIYTLKMLQASLRKFFNP